MTENRATLIGFSAVLLWALLAVFTVGSSPVPPLQLNAMTFAIGGAIGVIWVLATGGIVRLRGVSWRVYAFGTLGLFGYHALYFTALRLAPAAEAGLIAYLWPLLIVLFSGFLPGESLRPGHIIGALVSFAGAALILGNGFSGFDANSSLGYGAAILCALTWSSYSVLSRRLGTTPTDSVAVFCVATAILSTAAHVAIEDTQWPTTALGWASVAALGLGPVGLAFYTWDVGVKRGNIQLLGTASYAAPLLSTLVLILVGAAQPSPMLVAAALLVTLGAWLAARAGRAGRPVA
ncbi:DMT family transporter [Maritimibacter dapengensis]|uniref:EamA family transporter n=1 Tax=Maritimibacter dapengensis TaxID=2836868 RepID=A0ABS6T3D8_9RHOB|nr:EamA family transporter [Maritimibacter dapengensis]MBV7379737.1 EamA family transporter [Maritimibacter dapengensis]